MLKRHLRQKVHGKGETSILPRENRKTTLFRKLRVTQKHISSTPGVGAREKLWKRKNNYSGTEKDAVIPMTHLTVGRLQLFIFQYRTRQDNKGLHVTTVVISEEHVKLGINFSFFVRRSGEGG